MTTRIVSFYSFLHFFVDFACAVLLYQQVYPYLHGVMDIFYAFLLYNFFAFAIQFPIGIIADQLNKNGLIAGLGCLLISSAFFITPFGLTSVIIAGLGNAFFHVGAGIDVLNLSKGKATLPGIFVSTGAMGIFLGAQKFFNQNYMPTLFIVTLGLGAVFSYYIYQKLYAGKTSITIIKKFSAKELFMICCLCLTVLLRSYTGFVFAFEWKNIFAFGFIFCVGIVLGKMLGGIFSDRFGMKKTAVISLIFSSICFLFAFQNNLSAIIFGSVGVLLFNMTMPITLTALTNQMPHKRGTAFGLLTLMLFLGAIPALFKLETPFFSPIGVMFLILLSALILYNGLPKKGNG